MLEFFGILLLVIATVAALSRNMYLDKKVNGFKQHRKNKKSIDYQHVSHDILVEKVDFYSRLTESHQEQFRMDVAWFLSCTKIIGLDVEVKKVDEHLVAASAIIPIFHFQDWEYYELNEVLLISSSFNPNLEVAAADSFILGMVGTGIMEGKMILSQKALHEGFDAREDRENTAIHEFVHLIDKADGRIDGLPKTLMNRTYAIPWLTLIRHKMLQVNNGQTDINPYAGVNLSEFFAVTAEYFFERPEHLKDNHPELFEHMDKMFRGQLKEDTSQKYTA